MTQVLYQPAFFPNNPLLDSRIRGLPDYLFGAPPPLAWGNPFIRPKPVIIAPIVAPIVEPIIEPIVAPIVPPDSISLEDSISSTPEPLLLTPSTPISIPFTAADTQVDDDVRRIHDCIVKKKNLYDVLLNILSNRSYEHRTQYLDRYQEIYHANLLDDLYKQVKPHNYFFAVRAMLDLYRMTRFHSIFIAMEGKATGRFLSLEGLGTDEEGIAEILFMATNGQIHFCRNNWDVFYPTFEFERQLLNETSGNFSRLLLGLSKGNRDETGRIDMHQVNIDVNELYSSDENRTNNFINVFSRRSHKHLRLLFDEFHKQHGIDIITFMTISFKSLTGQIVGSDFVNALKLFVLAARDDVKLYAQRLITCVAFLTRGSIKDLPIDIVSNRQSIVRIIVTKHETDLNEIKEKYFELSGVQLEVSISECFKDTKFGPLRQLLLALLQEKEEELYPEVQQIHDAVIRKGKANKILFSILSSCNYEMRLKIVRQYNLHYKVNLLSKIEEFMKPGDQLSAIRSLVESYDVTKLRSLSAAIGGKGNAKLFSKETAAVDETAVTDLLFLATNKDISYFLEHYPRFTGGHDLIESLKREANGNGLFLDMSLKMLEGKRWEQSHTDTDLLKHDLVTFHQLATDEHAEHNIIEILTQRSFEHLRVLFGDFEEIYENTVIDHLTSSFRTSKQTDFVSSLLNCVVAVENLVQHYATKLNSCFEFIRERNGNTPDSASRKQTVLRILLTRAETDMDMIAEKFSSLSKDNASLEQTIQDVIRDSDLALVLNNLIAFKKPAADD